MLSWAQGKKTYLLAGFFVGLVCLLVGFGDLTPGLALDILAFALPCFAATFRSAIETHHTQVLEVLTEIAQIGADVRLHKPDVLAVDAETLVKLGGPVVTGTSVVQSPPTGILSGGWPDKASGNAKGGA